MESRAISDGQLSASSQWDANHATIQGRLHFQLTRSKAGSWSARTMTRSNPLFGKIAPDHTSKFIWYLISWVGL